MEAMSGRLKDFPLSSTNQTFRPLSHVTDERRETMNPDRPFSRIYINGPSPKPVANLFPTSGAFSSNP